MPYYLVSRTDNVGYDEYDSVVVKASNRREAIEKGESIMWHQPGARLSTKQLSENATFDDIGKDIVCASFNAG